MTAMLAVMLSMSGLFGATARNSMDVYVVKGKLKGPTLMVIGGIHGDEPSGYKATELYKKVSISKGTLILVPNANAYALSKNKRYVGRDMNRLFADGVKYRGYELKAVKKLKELMRMSDMVINLHEGEGFFTKDPQKYGQSIVIDAQTASLKLFAEGAIKRLNAGLKDKNYHFGLNCQDTMDKTTKHPEQRGSATYYALYTVGIPAFGVEVSKDINDEATRIAIHCMTIKIFADQLGISFEKTGDNALPACNINQ